MYRIASERGQNPPRGRPQQPNQPQMKQHCSFCCDYNRKQIPGWGSKNVLEVPGCHQCRIRYEAGLREAEAKVATVERQLDELKATLRQEKKRSKFLAVCRDSGIEGSDVTFIVEGLEISAHRAILADKSKVFEKMFGNRTLENETGAIHIEGSCGPVMEAVIDFCYTGEIVFTEAVPPDKTMKAAHEYQIEHLKHISESALCRRISIENAPELLKLSRLLSSTRLEAEAAEFFKQNFEALKPRLFEILDATGTCAPEMFQNLSIR